MNAIHAPPAFAMEGTSHAVLGQDALYGQGGKNQRAAYAYAANCARLSGKGVFGRWGSCGEEKVGTGFDGTGETAVPCLRFELARLLMRGRIACFCFC